MSRFSNTAVLLLFTALVQGDQISHERRDWRSKQVKWWDDDRLIKDAIVSTVRLTADHRSLQNDHAFVEHNWQVMSLLLLFDARQSPSSLQTLTSLSSYYLGEAGGEIYDCVLLRKGKRIHPYLTKLLATSSTECLSNIGRSPACLDDAEFRRHAREILARIEKDDPCTIEH